MALVGIWPRDEKNIQPKCQHCSHSSLTFLMVLNLTSYCELRFHQKIVKIHFGSPDIGILVVHFNKKHFDNFKSERFVKNPLCECSLYHNWTLLSKHHHHRGIIGTMLALHAHILCFAT